MLLAITLLLWASAFPGIRAGNVGYSPFHVAVLRYMVASLALAFVAILRRMRMPSLKDLPGIALMGLLGITGYNLALNYGERSVPSGPASFIVCAGPVFTSLLALLYLKERIHVWHWGGMLLSLAGVGIIALGGRDTLRFGNDAWIVLLAALLQSGYFVIQKVYLGRYTPLELATYAIWCGTIFLLVFFPGLLQQSTTAPVSATLAVVYLGVFPGAIGYVCWSVALSRMNVSRATGFLYLVPVLASLIAWTWLGEVPSLRDFLGGAVVLMGVTICSRNGQRMAESVDLRNGYDIGRKLWIGKVPDS